MTRPNLEEGYSFWSNEVSGLERPEKDVPYIPIIALVGVYAVFSTDPSQLTSYHWRQSVLRNSDALNGLRTSLNSYHKDEIGEDFEIPLSHLEPDETVAGGQLRHAYASIVFGMPSGVTSLPLNEVFLASTLGYAHYDHGVLFHPHLGLSEQGEYALRGNYPQTAAFIEEHSA